MSNIERFLYLTKILLDEGVRGEQAWFLARERGWIYSTDHGDVTTFYVTERGQAVIDEYMARA